MSYSYDTTTEVGRVRLLIPDRNASDAIFSDEEIATFLALEDGLKRATALALETIASDQVLVLKVQRTGQLQTDGKSVSDALLARAAKLRSQAEADDDADGGGFDIAEWVVDDFAARERWIKQVQRGVLG